ncbi:MAG: hypothetical protein GY771_00910 [bacterium]|nr:hypothetical protein [bacterium]
MEIAKKEHCPKCGSEDVRNQVYLRGGRNIQIFVECAFCGNLVARYKLNRYVTSSKRFNFLEFYRKKGFFGGERRRLKETGLNKKRIRDGWERAKELISNQVTNPVVKELIEEIDAV